MQKNYSGKELCQWFPHFSLRITWRSSKIPKVKATIQPNYPTVSGGQLGRYASIVFEAPQVMPIGRKLWEPLDCGLTYVLFIVLKLNDYESHICHCSLMFFHNFPHLYSIIASNVSSTSRTKTNVLTPIIIYLLKLYMPFYFYTSTGIGSNETDCH